MIYAKYVEGQFIKCPFCSDEQDGPVEDFVVPGKIGEPYRDECYNCGEKFYVTEVSSKQYEITD